MKTDSEIEQQVKITMESLTDYPKAIASDFFYTRLSTRLVKPEKFDVLSWIFETPYLKPVFALLILAINIVSISLYLHTGSQTAATQQTASEIFIEEYSLNQSTESYLVLNDE